MLKNPDKASFLKPVPQFQCLLGRELAIYQGMILDNITHSHYVVQICFGIDAPVEMLDEKGQWHGGRLLIIPSNAEHQLLPNPGRVVYFYLDPLFIPEFNRLIVLQDFPERVIEQAIEQQSPACIFNNLKTPQQTRRYDQRIIRAADLLLQKPDHELKELAMHLQISASRLRHIFKDELGLGTRRFRLWSRTMAAIQAVAGGTSLVDSAMLAGFADQSHFNRTVKHAFGITPSQLLHNPQVNLILI